MSNLKTVVEGITSRAAEYREADAYYAGNVKEAWTTAFMARRFGRTDSYKINFANVVVDAVNNRLDIDAVLATSDTGQSALNTIMEQNEMALETNEIHKRALVYGECYVIVWPDEEGNVEISYNSPLTTKVFYSNENQRKKEYAAKMWTEVSPLGRKSTRMNLYFDDRIEKYTVNGEVTSANNNEWTLFETVENPYGEVPVFHFRTHRPHGTPEHFKAYGAQDMINKLVRTHMDTIDYQGAPQRYALTGAMADAEADAFDDDDTDRENMDALKNGPGELWYLKGVNQVGQFSPADHKVFTEPLMVYTRAMAASTDTPVHYFDRGNSNPSGEALRTAEAPLVKKINDRQVSFGSTWRDVYRFALMIEGVVEDVQIKWTPVESLDSMDSWEVAGKKKLVGVAPEQIFLEMGYDSEIAKAMADRIDEQVANNNPTPGMNLHNQLAKEEPVSTDAGVK